MATAWMIYGANGFTGELIAQEAHRRGMKPVLAGRNAGKVAPMAEQLGFSWRAFSLDDTQATARGLSGMAMVLHCAGPFSATCLPMLEGCLSQGVHYLDITGEIDVFELIFAKEAAIKQAGIFALPGAGFDVVPTDTMASMLAKRMPHATHLELAFGGPNEVSRGTLATVIEGMPKGLRVRRNGKIENLPIGSLQRTIPFSDKPRHGVAIAWGDVSTAFYSTAIPNITVYTAMSPKQGKRLRRLVPFQRALGWRGVQALLRAGIKLQPRGPDAATRQTGRTVVWGQVSDAKGHSIEGTMELGESYAFTAASAVEAVARLSAEPLAPGVYTPSLGLGESFCVSLPHVSINIGNHHEDPVAQSPAY